MIRTYKQIIRDDIVVLCARKYEVNEKVRRPPRGCLITQSRTLFFIFTQSRTHFSHFHAIMQTNYFFQFCAIMHTFFPFSRNHAHMKGLFTPSRIWKRPFTHASRTSFSRNHAFSHFHAITQEKSAIHAITHTWGASYSHHAQNDR